MSYSVSVLHQNRRAASKAPALVVALSLLAFAHCVSAANTVSTVQGGATDLGVAAAYVSGTLAGTTNDVTFASGTTYTNASTMGLSAASISIGTLNDLNSTPLIITSSNSKTITLNGGSNTAASGNGGNASDLIYVASGGSLTYDGGIAISATAGTIDTAGTLVLNTGGIVSSQVSMLPNTSGNSSLAFTGAGNATITGVTAFDTGYNATSASSLVTLSNSGAGTVALGTIYLTQSSGTNTANLVVNAVNGAMSIDGIRGSGNGSNITFEGGNSIVLYTGTANFNSQGNYTGSLLNGGSAVLAITETGATTSVTLNAAEAQDSTGANTPNSSNSYTLNAGTLNLDAASALTGTATDANGTLNIGASAAFNGNLTLVVTGGTLNNTSGATITNAGEAGNQFNGSFNWAGSSALTLTGTNSIGGAGPSVTITTSGTSPLTLSGAIANGSSVVQLIKAGTGTLQLNGANSTFTGGAVVQSGTLTAGASGALGSGAITLGAATGSANATLLINSGGESNAITTLLGDTAPLLIGNSTTASATESGLITLNGNLQVAQASGGTLTFTGSFVGSSTASTPAVLTFVPANTANSISVDTISDGPGSGSQVSVVQTAGQLSINGPGSYSGGTTIESGTLTAAASGALGSGMVTMGTSGSSSNVTLLLNAGSESNSISTVASDTGTMTIGNTAAASATESGLVTLNTNLQVTQVAGGSLAFTGSFAGPSAAGTPITATFTPASTGSITASSLADGASTLAVTKSGAGTLTLAGVSTYSGATTVSTGILIYQGSGAMSANSTVTETSGAVIQFQGGVNGTGGSTLTISGTGEAGATAALENVSGTNSVSNPIFLASGPTSISSDAGSLTLTGGITGAHTLDLLSTNTGSMTFSGGVVNCLGVVNEGAGTGAVTINSAIGSSVTSGVTQSSTSSLLVLAGANTYGGATTINSGGAIQFDGYSATSPNSTITLGSTTNLNLLADTSGTFSTAGVSLPTGNTTLNINVGALTTGSDNTVTLAGTLTYQSAAPYSNVLNVTGSNGDTLALGNLNLQSSANNDTFTLNANNGSIVTTGTVLLGSYGQTFSPGGNGTVIVNNLNFASNGTSYLVVGSGSNTPTLTLLAATTSSGGRGGGGFSTTINNGGTLNVDAASAISNQSSGSATLTLNPGGDLNVNVQNGLTGIGTFYLLGGTINNISATAVTASNEGANQINGNFTWGGSGPLTLNGNSTLGASGTTVETITTTGTATLVLSGAISTSTNGGPSQLVEAGTGALQLNGANTYAGGNTLTGGELFIDNASALGSGAFTITSGTIGDNNSGTITDSVNENWNGNFAFSGPYAFSSGTAAITLAGSPTVTVNASTFTVNGNIAGPGSLTVAGGGGILALGGSNTIPGGVTLSSGEIAINKATALGVAPFTITSGTIDNTSGSSVTLANSIQVNGNFGWNGSNALTLNGTTSFGSASSYAINTAGSAQLLFAGPIASSTAQLVFNGSGLVAINGTNNATGGMVINGGEVNIGTGSAENTAALGSGPITVNGGSLQFTPASTNNAFYYANNFTLNGGAIVGVDGFTHLGATSTAVTGTINVLAGGGSLEGLYPDKALEVDGLLTGSGPLLVQSYTTNQYTNVTAIYLNNNNNTYSGTITVNGTANAGAQVNLGAPDALQYALVNLQGAVIGGTSSLLYTYNTSYNVILGGLEGNGNFALKTVGGSGINVSVGGDNLSSTYSGVMSSSGTLTKVGAGTLTLTGSNTYGGGTTVGAGTLIVSGSISGTAAVNNSATLGGDGVIGGAVTVNKGGALAPGAGETTIAGATLTLRSGLTLSGTSTLAINLDSSNDIDSLAITGNLSIGADDTLTLNLLNGASLNQASYVIATYTGMLTGTFAITNLPAGYTVNYGVAEPDTIEIVAVAIPEPGAFGTMLAGLGMFIGIQRWRKPRVGT